MADVLNAHGVRFGGGELVRGECTSTLSGCGLSPLIVHSHFASEISGQSKDIPLQKSQTTVRIIVDEETTLTIDSGRVCSSGVWMDCLNYLRF